MGVDVETAYESKSRRVLPLFQGVCFVALKKVTLLSISGDYFSNFSPLPAELAGARSKQVKGFY